MRSEARRGAEKLVRTRYKERGKLIVEISYLVYELKLLIHVFIDKNKISDEYSDKLPNTFLLVSFNSNFFFICFLLYLFVD